MPPEQQHPMSEEWRALMNKTAGRSMRVYTLGHRMADALDALHAENERLRAQLAAASARGPVTIDRPSTDD